MTDVEEPKKKKKKTTNPIYKMLNFLEAKLNDFKSQFQKENSCLSEELSKSNAEVKELREAVAALAKDNTNIRASVSSVFADLNKCVHKADAELYVDAGMELVKMDFVKIRNHLNELDVRQDNLNSLSKAMSQRVDKVEPKLPVFEEKLSAIHSDCENMERFFNQLKAQNDEVKVKNDKEKAALTSRLDFAEHSIKTLAEESIALKAEVNRKLNAESVQLAKSLDDKVDNLSADCSNKIDDMVNFAKKAIADINRIEDQMINAMQGGKVGKKMDDFIKQVTFNTRQIDGIKKSLEKDI